MARSFDRASSRYLVNATTPITAVPLTMACWFQATEGSNTKHLMSIGDSAALSWFGLEATSTETIEAETGIAGSFSAAAATGNFSLNTWTHAAAVFASDTSRAAYRDGTNKGTNAVSRIPTGLDKVTIGARNTNAVTNYMTGDIAEAAIWNIPLTDAEIALLAKGVRPIMVRPAALVAYWPLIGRASPEPDLIGGYDLTLTNSPGVSAHPRIYYPPKQQLALVENPGLLVSMAATEAADTFAGTVAKVRNVALAATESPDVFAGTVLAGIRTSMAATEAPDVLAANAVIERSISLAATEGADTAAFQVRGILNAALAATESADVVAFEVHTDIEAALEATESPDVTAFSVLVPYPPITEIVQRASPGALVILYELDLTSFGAGISRFTPMVSRDGPDHTEVSFGGNLYTPIPLMAKGFEKSAKGALARPRLQTSNVTNLVTQLLRDFGDLKGVRLTRIRTFAQYLDAPDGISPDTGQTLPVEEYIISRKAQHNKVFVEFELRAAIDIEGVVVPKRVLLRNCMARARIWDAATETFTYDTSDMACPYDGSFYFTKTNAFTTDPAEEGFAKTIDCCKTRFGERAVLPYHGFPGAARVR